jgi:hypothetical protein
VGECVYGNKHSGYVREGGNFLTCCITCVVDSNDNFSYLYTESALLESRPGYRLLLGMCSWFSSVFHCCQ